jgi:Cytochrome oxidase assembly factor
MKTEGKKISSSHLIIIFLLFFALLSYISINKFQKKREINLIDKLISINLIASVHPSLLWDFKPVKPNIKTKLGEVITAEYLVKNLGDKETSGIATFAYFPNKFGTYVNKINCFNYDVQTLKPR